MRPSTRSRSGVAKEPGKKLNEEGSRVVAPPAIQSLQGLVESAADVRQQEARGKQLEINSVSSSHDSDNASGDEGRSMEHRELDSELLEVEGGALADRVFVEMSQSVPCSVGVEQVATSGNNAAEKAEKNVQKAPWVSLFRDNRNLGKGIKLVFSIMFAKGENL